MNSDEVRMVEKLREEHRSLDARVQEMSSRRYLTPTEEYELKRLQKLKLAKKDEIAMLLARGGEAAVG